MVDKLNEIKEKYDRSVFEFNYDISKKKEEIEFLKLNYEKIVKEVLYFYTVSIKIE